MKLRLLFGVCGALALAIGGSAASAAASGSGTCAGGAIAPGIYNGMNVTGDCTVMGAVTINGNVTVADNAYLDAAYNGTRLTINGNVRVGKGAKLGLGCAYGYHDCGVPDNTWPGRVTVNGNVTAIQALTMYIDFTNVRGNVTSIGGGDITMRDGPNGEGVVFPIKDDSIGGNLTVSFWAGAWFGIIRDHVGGSVIAIGNVGTRTGDSNLPDSNEIVTNTIGGNLLCLFNNPHAQIGDSGGSPNTVAGLKLGECAAY